MALCERIYSYYLKHARKDYECFQRIVQCTRDLMSVYKQQGLMYLRKNSSPLHLPPKLMLRIELGTLDGFICLTTFTLKLQTFLNV